jgi:hypothetical protein
MESENYPRLRRLEAIPVRQQGREMIALRDPQGYFKNLVLVPPAFFYIASKCDGNRCLRDIQADYVRKFGDIITSDKLAAIFDELDDKLLLDSAKFRKVKAHMDAEYLSLPNRPMTGAGSAYAADPRALSEQIQTMISDAGELNHRGAMPLAVIAPHIDLERGWNCYGKIYSRLADSRPRTKTLVVILGTSHVEMEGPFAMTRKNYLTPFGLVETDLGLAEGMARAAGMQDLGDELSHRSEHSIEIQLPMLSFIFGGPDRFKILPITCNSFHQFIEAGSSPADDPRIGSFVSALKGLISAMRNDIFLVASADLAHVGNRFGSSIPLDSVMLSSVLAKDKDMLQRVGAGDAEGFYSYVAAERDSRHICGLAPIYTLVKALETEAELIDHCYWYDQQEGSAVTFAGMSFAG